MLGKPIVASDISGVRDTLGDGKYGTIVPPSDSETFGQALEEILNDLENARKRAEGGRNHLLEYMSAEKVAKEYLECYRKVLQK
jgi:glycosyltransferase involved in cell wall biosynthesis